MNNIEIAANAPTEAKYFGVIDDGPSGTELYLDGDLASCVKVWYLDDDKNWVEGDFDSFCIYGFKEFRSISDVSRIVELENSNKTLHELMVTGEKRGVEKATKEYRQRLEAAERERDRLIEYSEEQALLPESSFRGVRELVSDIQKDATDVGGCYEVSTGHMDSLFEAFTDSGACKLLNKFAIKQQIKALDEFALVPLSVANHHCDKEIAGYMWLHDSLTIRLNELHAKLNGDS